mmetsp:Transcript_569/g.1592  ORF Transcript_569/g.1592 Transcript_569/m.1592 type:complete len:325 (-) Transcript_569:122-1096(-)
MVGGSGSPRGLSPEPAQALGGVGEFPPPPWPGGGDHLPRVAAPPQAEPLSAGAAPPAPANGDLRQAPSGAAKLQVTRLNGHCDDPLDAHREALPAAHLPRPRAWPSLPATGPFLSAASELCHFCFRVLRAHLQSQPSPPWPAAVDPAFRAPLFVTWLKQRGGGVAHCMATPAVRENLELRGCIGCLEPVAFRHGLSEYALRSSLQDRRFPPVKLEEFPQLTCRLSILYHFETCAHVHDWQVGTHGVLINFADAAGRQYSATYLPEVAREHGMSCEVAIRELVAKAGYVGPCDQALLSCLQVTRYETQVETVAYGDFHASQVQGP